MLEHACFDSWHVYSRVIMHCDEWCSTFFFFCYIPTFCEMGVRGPKSAWRLNASALLLIKPARGN